VDPILAALGNLPAGDKPEGLTKSTILRYADEEEDRFLQLHRRYFNGAKDVRIDEVRHYLTTWQTVKRFNGEWNKLPNRCRNEILDRWYEETE
jgi:hypothetical protein